eukprot:Gb_37569 [translate_table: standard]
MPPLKLLRFSRQPPDTQLPASSLNLPIYSVLIMALFKLESILTLARIAAILMYCCLTDADTSVGVCYGRVADNLPPPDQVVILLKSNNISKIRIFDADPSVLFAFANTQIQLTIGVPNENLQNIAMSQDVANQWVQSNVQRFVPATFIKYIAVGNEILGFNNPRDIDSGGVIPPSLGTFRGDIKDTMASLLDFLARTGGPFMANVYPFFSYISNRQDISLQYAIFGSSDAVVNDGGLCYTNLFDATVDALISAMEKLGHLQIDIAITETGWPSAGLDPAATPANAMTYNANLIRHVMSDRGTPKRPGVNMESFVFGLFNEDGKPGADFERHFGLFLPTGVKVYDINFSNLPRY